MNTCKPKDPPTWVLPRMRPLDTAENALSTPPPSDPLDGYRDRRKNMGGDPLSQEQRTADLVNANIVN